MEHLTIYETKETEEARKLYNNKKKLYNSKKILFILLSVLIPVILSIIISIIPENSLNENLVIFLLFSSFIIAIALIIITIKFYNKKIKKYEEILKQAIENDKERNRAKIFYKEINKLKKEK